MSVEAPKTVEQTTAANPKPLEPSTETPTALTSETPATDATKTTETTDTPAALATEETKPAEENPTKDEAVVEVVPASEGVLGYKAPGFLKQFHFSKHFFWFSEEPLAAEALSSYVRSDKSGVAHNAAWARETGKGVLFHTKRAEDKASPAGLIPLAEATNVAKEGLLNFSFEVQGKTHKFEATSVSERDSWFVAIEKQVEESKTLKDDITGKDSYKKNVDEYSKPFAVAAVATSRSKSKEPKKSLDVNTATAAATTETKPEETAVSPAAPVEEKKKETAKERSQSRKRTSIFGSLIGKKDENKEEKKAEEKVEKEEKKEEKKAEAEIKKEEAKEEHDAPKAAEAAAATVGAAAIAAAPAAIVTDKKEDETPAEATATTPTEKKAKRGSVFGSLFSKKVTSPTTEKTEKEVGPAPPAKDGVPPVSDTAPKLDEPIENKPIDAAAVTAPSNTDGPAETTKETPAETKTEKKGFLGFIKKPESKREEVKEDKPAEVKATEPVAATEATTATTETTDAVKPEETPAAEEKPAVEKEKRRTSIFGGLGTLKKKKDESETAEDGTERKREKSPLPGRIGGLFRKPSKAVKSDETKPADTKETETKTETPVAATTTEPSAATTDAPATADVPATTEATDSKIVGDVVPETLQAHDKTAPEVKASA